MSRRVYHVGLCVAELYVLAEVARDIFTCSSSGLLCKFVSGSEMHAPRSSCALRAIQELGWFVVHRSAADMCRQKYRKAVFGEASSGRFANPLSRRAAAAAALWGAV